MELQNLRWACAVIPLGTVTCKHSWLLLGVSGMYLLKCNNMLFSFPCRVGAGHRMRGADGSTADDLTSFGKVKNRLRDLCSPNAPSVLIPELHLLQYILLADLVIEGDLHAPDLVFCHC
jgi:hypothetical protein